MEKQVTNFLEFLKTDKKLSENTLQSYKRDILQYMDYINKNNINHIETSFQDRKTEGVRTPFAHPLCFLDIR